MKFFITTLNLNNHLLKLSSMIFGYFFWLVLAQNQLINREFEIPLSFYGLKNNFVVNTIENIKIVLSGKRVDFYNLDYSNLAAHVNLENINSEGEYQIKLLQSHIFLHNKIKLLDYNPSTVSIKIEKNNQKND